MEAAAPPWPLLPTGARVEPIMRRMVRFARALHDRGLLVDPARVIDLCRSFEFIDLADRATFYAAARATLVARHDDMETFDKAFFEYWTLLDRHPNTDLSSERDEGDDGEPLERPSGSQRESAEGQGDEPGEEQPLHTGWSADEVLMHKNLALMSEVEIERARRILSELIALLATVRGRRWAPVPGGSRLDLRRMLRKNALYGRDAIEFRWRRRKRKKLKLMLLCDVSGSMERYSNFLVQFIYALRRELPAVEVGVFATRMTVVSDLLSTRDIAQSLRQISATVRDWGGGTDIGGCLREFNDRFAREMLYTKTIMVIMSDGWDRGDATVMRTEIEHLRRRVHKLIWLNPLLGTEGYEPLCRGIRTALPHLDYFLPVHNLASLAELAKTLRSLWH